MFNMFAGGAVERMAIFALNIMPYISASIIMQLMTLDVADARGPEEGGRGGPQADQPVHALPDGGAGRASRPTASPSASKARAAPAGAVVIDPGWFFRITTVITLVGGTMFLMWLGEQITARGVGNGISLIIFAGIVAGLPSALVGLFELARTGSLSGFLLFVLLACRWSSSAPSSSWSAHSAAC